VETSMSTGPPAANTSAEGFMESIRDQAIAPRPIGHLEKPVAARLLEMIR